MPSLEKPDDVGVLLDRWRLDRAHEIAIRSADRSGWSAISWAEFAEAVDRVAVAASVLLPEPGPVLTVIDNSVDSVCVLLGLWRGGRDTLLLEASNSYLDDAQSMIWRSGASALVRPDRMTVLGGERLGHSAGYAELTSAAGPRARTAARATREPSVLQVTSGATGEPRIAVHPLRNLLHGGILYRDVHGLTAADTVMAPVPLAHSFGVVGGLMASVCAGAELATMPRLLLRRLAEAVTRPGAIVLGTPLLYRLATTAGPELAGGRAAVKTALCSGGPLPPAVADAVRQWLGRDLCQVYGSTETGLISCEFAGGGPWPPGSVGKPAPGVRVRLAEPRLDGLGSELLVRTSTMLTGYLGEEPLAPGVYWNTGDLGVLDPDGRLYLTGRKETFINVGGRKVNPVRIERILRDTELVRDIAIYGIDCGQGDEEIHAAVELSPGTAVDEVRAACARLLSSYERPGVFHVMDELPRGALGKVQRARLPG